ncbi:hypothetical protein ACA910_001654 [Epithemia clementina (nom. ined.)]
MDRDGEIQQEKDEIQNEKQGNDKDDDVDEEARAASQHIRISFRLAPEFEEDATLVVPSEAIAIPSHLTRKGLSTVLNHLLGRDSEPDEEEEEGDDKRSAATLPSLQFDFLVGPNSRRLLRTTLDKEVRQAGLSLEQALKVTYFPSCPAPSPTEDEGPELPDWISALKTVTVASEGDSSSSLLVSACYDGSLHILHPASNSKSNNQQLKPLASTSKAHAGPIKCMDAFATLDSTSDEASASTIWMATGSMDHTVALHSFHLTESETEKALECRAMAQHAASVSSVKFWPHPKTREGEGDGNGAGMELRLASGDWDGGVFVWRFNPWDFDNNNGNGDRGDDGGGPSSKKLKASSTSKGARQSNPQPQRLTPTISLQAHNSKVSGLAFFGDGKGGDGRDDERLVTCSWDYSIKVWNMERQDCLLSLNSSRVVGCLDTSPHSPGICVTGHPDCSLRLWDVRVGDDNNNNNNNNTSGDGGASSILVSDNVFRPSHKAWISHVQWSCRDPYQIYSCSHDGTLKVWDIRSATPLHTVRVLPSNNNDDNQNDKLFSLATMETDTIFTGGTTCVVKQFQMKTTHLVSSS